ncbi:MAG: hypothetical protein LBG58_08865 [Planctomycetaceae bacterium]|nr:hypothetical protein [Planctomycetaceae bacterium]
MNQIRLGNLCFRPVWKLIADGKQGQVGYRRRNLSAKGCLPLESNKNNQYHAVCGMFSRFLRMTTPAPPKEGNDSPPSEGQGW